MMAIIEEIFIEDLEQRVDELEKRVVGILEFFIRVTNEFIFCSGSKQVPGLCGDAQKMVDAYKAKLKN